MASRALLFAFVLCAGFATRSFAEYNISCTMDVHANCDKELTYLMQANSALTWSEEELSEYCSEIVEDITCKQEYLQTCSNRSAFIFFEFLTRDLRDTVRDICNETSDMRSAFRSHNACFKINSQEFEGCFLSSVLQSMAIVYEDQENMTMLEKRIKSLCVLQETFKDCATSAVRTPCGEEAANFMDTILTRPFVQLREELCVDGKFHNYDAELEFKKIVKAAGY